MFAQSINHNASFGHYNPAVVVQPLSAATAPVFLSAFNTPLSSTEDGSAFLSNAARFLPSFQRIRDGLTANGVMLVPREEVRHPAIGLFSHNPQEGEDTNSWSLKFLAVPTQYTPYHYMNAFIYAASPLLPPPSGVYVPHEIQVRTIQDAKRLLWDRYYLHIALGASLCFQVAFEMGQLGINTDNSSDTLGILGPIDLAMFDIMRESDLQAVANGYKRFMMASVRSNIEESIEREAAKLVSPSARPYLKVPQLPDDMLQLERTPIDMKVDSMRKHELGLFMKDDVSGTRIEEAERARLMKIMDEPFERTEDIQDVIHIIRTLAPALAAKIATNDILRKIEFQGTRGLPPQSPVAIHGATLPILMGRESPGRTKVFVEWNTRKMDIAENLLMHLARLVIPEDINGSESVGRRDEEEIFQLLKRLGARYDLWGYTALFEFVNEASQRGVIVPLDDNLKAMRQRLEDCGFWVLREHYDSFTNPTTVAMMNNQYRDAARQLAGKGK